VNTATTTIKECQPQLDALVARYKKSKKPAVITVTTSPSTVTIAPDDRDLLAKAMAARNGAGSAFTALWGGNIDGYASQSEADLALLCRLAWWTGEDVGRMDRLFRQSGLYREKWERADYREDTIAKAIEHNDSKRYTGGRPMDGTPTTHASGVQSNPNPPAVTPGHTAQKVPDNSGGQGGGTRPVLIRLSDVEPEEIEFIWPGRLALGKLNMIVGDPGLGKSFLTLDISARISAGCPWPDGGVAPRGTVIIMTAEDGIADTVVPRLIKMGADTKQIYHLQSVVDPDNGRERLFQLHTDIATLEEAIGDVKPLLVVVDPLSSYLQGIDSHKSAEVRSGLAPLMTLGERKRVCLVAVAHLSKAETKKVLYRVSGSLDFVAAARAAFLVGTDPEDEDRQLMLSIKMNIAEKPPALGYSITDGGLVWDNRPVTASAADILGGHQAPTSKNAAAKTFLVEFLSAGPRLEKDIEEQVAREDFSMKTVWRAKKELNLTSAKAGLHGGWNWGLPEDV